MTDFVPFTDIDIDLVDQSHVDSTDKFRKKIYSDAEEALKHRNTEKLTEDQRFAIAFLAGVPVRFNHKDSETGMTVIMTTDPCTVAFDSGYCFVSTSVQNIRFKLQP